MLEIFPTAGFSGDFQPLLAEAVFPGKLAIWVLAVVSVASWVMIVAKVVQLRRMSRADEHFTARLRDSRTTLELFEEGWPDENSLHYLIYLAGAREASWQLIGSREPVDRMKAKIQAAQRLDARQFEFLNLAFRTGYRAARVRLASGVVGFRLVAVASLLLGGFAGTWILMNSFGQASDFPEVLPALAEAFRVMLVALVVAIPPIMASFAVSMHVRRRKLELSRFRDNLARLFARNFVASELKHPELAGKTSGAPVAPHGQHVAAREEALMSSIRMNDLPGDTSSGKRPFHSLRDRLLGASEDAESKGDANKGGDSGEKENFFRSAERRTEVMSPV